jgi:hypothetical protein
LRFISISAPGPKLTDFRGEESKPLELFKLGKLLSLIAPCLSFPITDNFGEADADPKLIISGVFIMIN